MLILPNAAVVAPGHVVSAALALADAIGRPVLAPDSPFRITRDGAVLAVRTPGPDGTAFGRGWRPGNWVLVYPRFRNQAQHTLPHSNLADAIRAGREPGQLGWAVQVGGRPGLVPPPSEDVHYPAQTSQRAIDNWRADLAAAHQLAAVTRELLPHVGDSAALEDRLDRADRAVRAVPAPPAAQPGSPQDQATTWRDLDRFQRAASDLGRAAADVLGDAFARWQEGIEPSLDTPAQVRELLPRTAGPALKAELAGRLERLDVAVTAIPRPPTALPATAAQVEEATSAIERIDTKEPQRDVARALSDVLTVAAGHWDARVADAVDLAAAAEVLLPHTGEHQDLLRRRLIAGRNALTPAPASPTLPVDLLAGGEASAEYAWQELGKMAALEDATSAVLDTATALDGLRPWMAAVPDLFKAANEMLPYTDDRFGLTDRLRGATRGLLEIWAGWWNASETTAEPVVAARQWLVTVRTSPRQVDAARPWLARGPELTTKEQVEAAQRWLAGADPGLLRQAVAEFEGIITEVATAATKMATRLERLVRQANELLPHTGAQRRALGLALFTAGGTPADAQFTAPRWPPPQPGAAVEVALVQAVAQDYAALQPRRLEDAVRGVFAAALTEWQSRLRPAIHLSGRLMALPEAVTFSHVLQWDLAAAHRNIWSYAARLISPVPDWRLPTVWTTDEAAEWLGLVPYSYQTAEAGIRNTIDVVVDEPMRAVAAAVGLNGQLDGLLPHVDQQLRDRLLSQRAAMQPFRPVPAPAASLPLAEIDEALSQALARLRGLKVVAPAFTADIAAAINAGWNPRMTAVTALAKQARDLLRQAVTQLADARLQALDGALTAAEQDLPGQPPVLPASPRAAELDEVRQALASVTAVEMAAAEVLTGVNVILEARETAALQLSAAASRLLPRTAGRKALAAALEQAEQNVRNQVGPGYGPLTWAATIDDARQRLGRLSSLSRATRDVLTAATAASDELQPQAKAARRLARDARALLPRTGQQRNQLTSRLDRATRRLRESRPPWWDNGTLPATVQQTEAALQALRRDVPGRLVAAAGETEAAVAALLNEVDVRRVE